MNRFCLILCLLYALPASSAYEFPYKDPYYATITAALIKADERDKNHRAEEFSFNIYSERNSIPLIGSRNIAKVSYWAGQENRPLIVMVAGLGGSAKSSTISYLAHQFNLNGYHVLTLPSPFHWTFALSTSDSSYPGITRDDANDLYKLIQVALKKIRSSNKHFSKIGLLGISMGALEAGYLSAIDEKEQAIGFKRTLLINPPVDVFFGINTLDNLYDEKKSMSPEQRVSLRERAQEFFAKAIIKDIKSPDYLLDIEKRFPTSIEERKFIIGQTMREFLAGLVFTTQQIKDRGVLKSPRDNQNPNNRLKESSDWSFNEYIEKLLVPEISERRKHALSSEEIAQDTFFQGIETSLKSNSNVYLMHNEDDFIVNNDQLLYLQNIFGMRMRLYPNGGHVGNIWYPENLNAILSTFQNLN